MNCFFQKGDNFLLLLFDQVQFYDNMSSVFPWQIVVVKIQKSILMNPWLIMFAFSFCDIHQSN